jgi:hypothetical protein
VDLDHACLQVCENLRRTTRCEQQPTTSLDNQGWRLEHVGMGCLSGIRYCESLGKAHRGRKNPVICPEDATIGLACWVLWEIHEPTEEMGMPGSGSGGM